MFYTGTEWAVCVVRGSMETVYPDRIISTPKQFPSTYLQLGGQGMFRSKIWEQHLGSKIE